MWVLPYPHFPLDLDGRALTIGYRWCLLWARPYARGSDHSHRADCLRKHRNSHKKVRALRWTIPVSAEVPMGIYWNRWKAMLYRIQRHTVCCREWAKASRPICSWYFTISLSIFLILITYVLFSCWYSCGFVVAPPWWSILVRKKASLSPKCNLMPLLCR